MPDTAETDPLTCRNCGSAKWSFLVTYSTEIDLSNGVEAHSQHERKLIELRCKDCDRKATMENSRAIRALDVYNTVYEREVTE
jgi:transcription elongation factor Elf1